MQHRFVQVLLAELLAFGAFVFGGLALVGGAVTWTGDSKQPVLVSWTLVLLFAGLSVVLGRFAAARLKRAFVRVPAARPIPVRVRR